LTRAGLSAGQRDFFAAVLAGALAGAAGLAASTFFTAGLAVFATAPLEAVFAVVLERALP
jgi:hypothetical protein